MLIRHLSGGQVKRASLANELVARPSLLFLDEVTSGLDEQTDREVMELFRQVADGGKTVVCITHSLANVEATCHLVVILTEGGRLAFVGTPDEAKAYFRIPRLGDVYRKLAERTPADWHDRFRASPLLPALRGRPDAIVADSGRAPRRGRRSLPPAAPDAVSARPGSSPGATSRSGRATGRRSSRMLGQSLLVALLLGPGVRHLERRVGSRRAGATDGQPALPAGRVLLLVRLQHGGQGAGQGAGHLPARARLQPPGQELLRLEARGLVLDQRGSRRPCSSASSGRGANRPGPPRPSG